MRNDTATAPNKVWLTDITYIPTGEGWLYLAGHKDMFTGEIVGYAMGVRMTKNLVSQSLFRAVAAKRPDPGLSIIQIEAASIAPQNTESCLISSK